MAWVLDVPMVPIFFLARQSPPRVFVLLAHSQPPRPRVGGQVFVKALRGQVGLFFPLWYGTPSPLRTFRLLSTTSCCALGSCHPF